MKRLISLAFITSLLFAVPTDAARSGPHYTRDLETLLPEVALNAAIEDRTFELPTNVAIGTTTLMMFVKYTHGSDGQLDVTCTGGPSKTDNDYTPTTCVVVAGVCTLKFGGKVQTDGDLTADTKFWARIGISGAKDVKCTATESTPIANDKVEIKGYLIAE